VYSLVSIRNFTLFKFNKEQKIFEIGHIRIGGQPGELPTVLVGSIFHEGHGIVKDRNLGVFDRKKAEHLINMQDEISERTGIPCMVDVVAENSGALVKYIDFVSKITDAPLLINGPNKSVRIAASKYAVEVGLQERIVYNSINYTLSDEEINAIKEVGLKAAIVQAFNPRLPTPKGMISILKELLQGASKAGIEKTLILTPVLDVPSIGFAAYGVYLAKEEFGIPSGTAPVGVIGKWSKVKNLGEDMKKLYRAGVTTLTQVMGANFLIYGSIAKARDVFPVVAMIDAIVAYNARNYGVKPLTKDHPLYKVF